MICIHEVELKDSTLQFSGIQGSSIEKSPRIFQNFSIPVPQFLHVSVPQSVHYALHSYSVAILHLIYIILKWPISVQCHLICGIFSDQTHSHPTSWKKHFHLSTFILLFLYLSYGDFNVLATIAVIHVDILMLLQHFKILGREIRIFNKV